MKRADLEAIKKMIERREYAAARDALKTLDAGGEATAESQYLLGSIYHRMNALSDAVQAFKRSLLLDPGFTDSAISLSVIYNDTGNYREAREVFEQAEACLKENQGSASNSTVLDRELASKHIELGKLYQRLQRFDAAAHEFIKATRLDAKNWNARVLLAKTLAQRGQIKLAQKELENLVSEQPSCVPARLHLALLLYANGNAVDARMELQQALLFEPQNKQVRMYLDMTEQATESVVPEQETANPDRDSVFLRN